MKTRKVNRFLFVLMGLIVLMTVVGLSACDSHGDRMREIYQEMDPVAQRQHFLECLKMLPPSVSSEKSVVKDCESSAFSYEQDLAEKRVDQRRSQQ